MFHIDAPEGLDWIIELFDNIGAVFSSLLSPIDCVKNTVSVILALTAIVCQSVLLITILYMVHTYVCKPGKTAINWIKGFCCGKPVERDVQDDVLNDLEMKDVSHFNCSI